MGIDYTEYFKTPEELVDFLMLDADEQGRVLLQLIENKDIEQHLFCSIKNDKVIQSNMTIKKGAELGH